MYKSESPYLEDWLIVSLRWFVLFGVTVSILLKDQFSLVPLGLLVFLAIWNAVVSMAAAMNSRFYYHRGINLTIDLVVTALFFWLQGGDIFGPALWLIFLSVVSGALYYDFKGGSGAAFIMALVEGSSFFLGASLLEISIGIVATLGLGFSFG